MTKRAEKRTVRYRGRIWEIKAEHSDFVLIERRGRWLYSLWLHVSVVIEQLGRAIAGDPSDK